MVATYCNTMASLGGGSWGPSPHGCLQTEWHVLLARNPWTLPLDDVISWCKSFDQTKDTLGSDWHLFTAHTASPTLVFTLHGLLTKSSVFLYHVLLVSQPLHLVTFMLVEKNRDAQHNCLQLKVTVLCAERVCECNPWRGHHWPAKWSQCLKPAFSQVANRGRLRRLRKEVSFC